MISAEAKVVSVASGIGLQVAGANGRRPAYYSSRYDLSANFSTLVLSGMNVEVPLAREKLVGLLVGELRRAGDRARRRTARGDVDDDRRVGPGPGGPVEMRRRRRTGEPPVGDVPAKLMRRLLIGHLGIAAAGAVVGRHLARWRERRGELDRLRGGLLRLVARAGGEGERCREGCEALHGEASLQFV